MGVQPGEDGILQMLLHSAMLTIERGIDPALPAPDLPDHTRRGMAEVEAQEQGFGWQRSKAFLRHMEIFVESLGHLFAEHNRAREAFNEPAQKVGAVSQGVRPGGAIVRISAFPRRNAEPQTGLVIRVSAPGAGPREEALPGPMILVGIVQRHDRHMGMRGNPLRRERHRPGFGADAGGTDQDRGRGRLFKPDPVALRPDPIHRPLVLNAEEMEFDDLLPIHHRGPDVASVRLPPHPLPQRLL